MMNVMQGQQSKDFTTSLLERFPPNKRTTESDTPVESRRMRVLTFVFSLNTSHGNGIRVSWAFTEI